MKKALLGSLYFIPMLAFAQTPLGNIVTLVTEFGRIVRLLGPIVFSLAIIYFFWGIAKYVLAAGDPKAAAEGRSIMIWGVIAIAVMASIYGLVLWLQSTLGVQNTTTPIMPTLP
jgi:hypothetical protein